MAACGGVRGLRFYVNARCKPVSTCRAQQIEAMRRSASSVTATSSCVVDQLLTEIRSTARLRQVDPLIRQLTLYRDLIEKRTRQ